MSVKTRGRRSGVSILESIDMEFYSSVVKQALLAFSRDTAYSIDMARAAATIESKRTVWQKRLEVRKAEEIADSSLSLGSEASLV